MTSFFRSAFNPSCGTQTDIRFCFPKRSRLMCLCRPAQQPTSHIPSAALSKIRRPAAAVAGRPSTHLLSAHRATTPTEHHHIPSGCPEALSQPTTSSSSSLTSARRAAPSQNRHLPAPSELPALSRAGRPGDNAAAAGRTAGLAAAARGAGTYGPASGRPMMRQPTIEPSNDKMASPLLSRHVGPRSYMTTRCVLLKAPIPICTEHISFVLSLPSSFTKQPVICMYATEGRTGRGLSNHMVLSKLVSPGLRLPSQEDRRPLGHLQLAGCALSRLLCTREAHLDW